jgi:hypothetical protein
MVTGDGYLNSLRAENGYFRSKWAQEEIRSNKLELAINGIKELLKGIPMSHWKEGVTGINLCCLVCKAVLKSSDPSEITGHDAGCKVEALKRVLESTGALKPAIKEKHEAVGVCREGG